MNSDSFLINKLKSAKFSVLIYLLYCFIITATFALGNFRQLKYSIPVLIILFWFYVGRYPLLKGRIKYLNWQFILWGIFFLYSLLALGLSGDSLFIYRSTKEFLFIISPLIIASLLFYYCDHHILKRLIKITLWSLLFAQLFRTGIDISYIFDIKSFFITSKTNTESTFALAYGLLFFFFFLEKNWWYSAISFLLVIIGGKRIVLATVVLLAIALPFIYRLFKKKKWLLFLGIGLFNVFVISFYIILANGFLDNLIYSATGLSIEYITKGRTSVYSLVIENTGYIKAIGDGLGFTSSILQKSDFILELMHSDILKLYLELGVFGLTAYLISIYLLGLSNVKSLIIVTYINIIMSTGNPLIYFHVMTIFYVIIIFYLRSNKNEKLKSIRFITPKVRNSSDN